MYYGKIKLRCSCFPLQEYLHLQEPLISLQWYHHDFENGQLKKAIITLQLNVSNPWSPKFWVLSSTLCSQLDLLEAGVGSGLLNLPCTCPWAGLARKRAAVCCVSSGARSPNCLKCLSQELAPKLPPFHWCSESLLKHIHLFLQGRGAGRGPQASVHSPEPFIRPRDWLSGKV